MRVARIDEFRAKEGKAEALRSFLAPVIAVIKVAFDIAALAVLLVVPGVCFAMWDIELVSKDRAKELGMEVRSEPVSPTRVRVDLEFKTEGEFKNLTSDKAAGQNYGSVELCIGLRDDPLVTAPLREDRSKPGRVVVSFTVDPAELDKLSLRVNVPETLGGSIYELRVKDFVELKKNR
jgi:hypothetical protein